MVTNRIQLVNELENKYPSINDDIRFMLQSLVFKKNNYNAFIIESITDLEKILSFINNLESNYSLNPSLQ